MKIKSALYRIATLGALPYLAFCALYLVPLAITFVYAFSKNPIAQNFRLFDNFSYLLSNRYFLMGFFNLFSIGLLMVAFSFAVSLVIAPVLCLHPRLSKPAVALLILPMMIPSVSAAVFWKNVFDTRSILEIAKARMALVTLFAWKYAGLGSAVLFSALKKIPESLTDAAKMDGAGRLRTYFSVRLPCIPGEIGITLGLNIVFMFRIYKESYLLFGAYPSNKVYMLQHYMNHQYTNMSFPHVAASAVFLIFFALILYALTYLLIIKRRRTI